MNAPQSKVKIDDALRAFAKVPLKNAARGLFAALGYESEKTLDLRPGNLKGFQSAFDAEQNYPDDWKNLPIPDVPTAQQQPVVKLVDRILSARRADPAAAGTAIEAELDILVGKLYGLEPIDGAVAAAPA